MSEPRSQGKTHDIPKQLVWDAWLKVKRKGGAGGADGVTIEQFGVNVKDNLYKLWNRMSSGSYFPGPVRAVEIPKKGGTRILGIPNVVDRIAQTVAVLVLEPELEKVFHDDSFGYRPGRSALDAVAVCRERCFKNDWVVDMDIKAFFRLDALGVDAEGGRASHGLEMGSALRGALAESPDADARWHPETPDNGNTARRPDFSAAR
jgi:hypothetical protein